MNRCLNCHIVGWMNFPPTDLKVDFVQKICDFSSDRGRPTNFDLPPRTVY